MFLGFTFDRTLSFGLHVYSPSHKVFSPFKALRSIAFASWVQSRSLPGARFRPSSWKNSP